MNQVIRAFHGTRDIEGIIGAGSIKCPIKLDEVGRRGDLLYDLTRIHFYDIVKSNYEEKVKSLAAAGKAVLEKEGFLGLEGTNERLLLFPEAIADLMEQQKSYNSDYRESKRNLFVCLTTRLGVAQNYADGVSGRIGGIVEVNLDLNSIRRGLNCYRNDHYFIEFPKEVSLDCAVNMYVRRTDFASINWIMREKGLDGVNLLELK